MITSKKNKKNKLGLILMVLLIAVGNFPFFMDDKVLILFSMFVTLVFIKKGYKLGRDILLFTTVFVFIFVLQLVLFGTPIAPLIGFILRLYVAYMAILIIGKPFLSYYINIIYFFSIVSFFFYFFIVLIPSGYNFLMRVYLELVKPIQLYDETYNYNIIIYTFDKWFENDFPRNAGPFWEPGAFGIFLILAIVFNTLKARTLNNKKNGVFLVASLLTFSLGTYSTILFFITGFLSVVNRSFYSLLLPLILFFSYTAYNKYDFLGHKLEYRYSKFENRNASDYEDITAKPSRFLATKLDIKEFLKSPLVGRKILETEYVRNTNSSTSLLRQYGIIGFVFFFYFLYLSFSQVAFVYKYQKLVGWLILFSFTIAGLSQSLFNKPFFLSILFLFVIYKNTHEKFTQSN